MGKLNAGGIYGKKLIDFFMNWSGKCTEIQLARRLMANEDFYLLPDKASETINQYKRIGFLIPINGIIFTPNDIKNEEYTTNEERLNKWFDGTDEYNNIDNTKYSYAKLRLDKVKDTLICNNCASNNQSIEKCKEMNCKNILD